MRYYAGSHLPMVYDTACLGARNPGHYSLLAPCARIGSLTAYALLVIALGRRECGTNLIDVIHLVKYHDVVLMLNLYDREHTPHACLLPTPVAHAVYARLQIALENFRNKRQPYGPLLYEVDVVVECGVVLVGASRHDVVEAELGETTDELAVVGDNSNCLLADKVERP